MRFLRLFLLLSGPRTEARQRAPSGAHVDISTSGEKKEEDHREGPRHVDVNTWVLKRLKAKSIMIYLMKKHASIVLQGPPSGHFHEMTFQRVISIYLTLYLHVTKSERSLCVQNRDGEQTPPTERIER